MSNTRRDNSLRAPGPPSAGQVDPSRRRHPRGPGYVGTLKARVLPGDPKWGEVVVEHAGEQMVIRVLPPTPDGWMRLQITAPETFVVVRRAVLERRPAPADATEATTDNNPEYPLELE